MTTEQKPWMNRTPYQVYFEALWSAPEGYALVPIEPTPDMFNAGQACGGYADRVYRAMLAAAPSHAETR
ncbi:hypothetical protein [Pararobbsia alpina]|uniref:Uncharacterized protein n=1 Tax=Pararobbsia alpina TaxID=621374 RepID=A0A6S7CPG1_9BURK|nr:hypothetical protein [Pararobbsia alpina]CAB3784598.1 hypothetical protein LMG28138_01841 [Pararobbsia alpina]